MKTNILTDMMLFVAVVENKSFTAAADQFGITKSVVSKRVTRLEKDLGVQLLFRSTRKLSLTEAGETLFDHCLRIKTDLEEAELAVTATHAEPRGLLRINCPGSFGYLHLAPAVADFTHLHPQIKVQILVGALYEDLIDSSIDLSLRIGALQDSNLMARRITMRPMRVCASPDYLAEHGTPEAPEDLKQHNCLSHTDPRFSDEWRFERDGRTVTIPIKGTLSASSSQTLEVAAVNGMGIVMLPGYMMTNDIKQGNLISLLEDYCPNNIGIYAVYPHTFHLATKVRVFIDFLCERFGTEEYWH